MESEEAATKSSPSCEKSAGFIPVENSLFLETKVAKDSNLLNVNWSSSSSPSNGSSFVSFSSDDNGFVSSEEGFETASEKPIIDCQDNETIDISTVGGDSCETFVGFSQFSMSTKDIFVEVDDDVEKFKKVGVLKGGEVEEKLVDSCEAFSGEDSSEIMDRFLQFSKSIKNVLGEVSDDDCKKTSKVGVLVGGEVEEKLVDNCETFSGEDLGLIINGSVNSIRQDNNVMEYKGGNCSEKSEDFSLVPKEGSVGKENDIVLKGNNDLEDDKIKPLIGEISDSEKAEKHVLEQLSADVRFERKTCSFLKESSLGEDTNITLKCVDALEDEKVEALNSEISVTGVIEKLALEQASAETVKLTEDIEVTCEGTLTLNNEYDEVNVETVGENSLKTIITPTDSELDESDGVKFTPDGDYVAKDIHVNLSAPIVAVLAKEKEEADGSVRSDFESYYDEITKENNNSRQLNEDSVGQTNPVENIHVDVLEPGAADVCNVVKTEEANGVGNVTDSDGVATDDEEEEGKVLFDSEVLTALLKAAAGVGSGGSVTVASQDLSRLISFERPASSGSSVQSFRPAARPKSSNFFSPSSFADVEESVNSLSEEEKRKLEKLQSIRVRFLRFVKRLGLSGDEPLVARVLYRLGLVAGRHSGQIFGLDAAKRTALQVEEDRKEDTNFSLNILVLGKPGVGKSSTINSIFGEEKARIDAFQPATSTVKEITGVVDGIKIRVFDTPGLKSHVTEQSFNRSVLSSVKKFTKKIPLDVVLYVDRLDAQTRDLDDLPLLQTINSSLGSSIWRTTVVTLTHAASLPPEGPSGSPISYDVFITQRSRVLQKSIEQAVGDRSMSANSMNPVCLVENHLLCRKNREGQKVLPNGEIWKQHLLILCYSIKIITEANSFSKSQEPFDTRRLFGYLNRFPSFLPFLMSSTLQSQVHPKLLSSEQGGYNCDADIDLADLSDSDKEEDDEYNQLPPFKPLKKSRLSKLSKEQRKAYFEEYDYRVKVLQKKQWKEELERMKEIKRKGKDSANDYAYTDEDPDAGSAAPMSVPLPDTPLPPSFDSDNPAHRYRFLEPTLQFLARPALDTHGWDHDCGYEGVNLEQSLAILSRFPAVISAQLRKDKREFNINLNSSIAAKHGENGSSIAGFDIQNMGKQFAYIIRGETKFKNFRKNKTAAGVSVTFLGENVVTGLKVEDQISFGKQYSLVASAGTVRSQQDVAYGANIEMQRRELEYPIGQVQSSFGLSLIKLRGDLGLGFNSLAQFSTGRNSKVAVRAEINNKLSGQISVRTSSSEHLSLALASILPVAISIYNKFYPGGGDK